MKRAVRVYVSSPYWHEKKHVRVQRADAVASLVFELMERFPANKVVFYSPIAHTRGIEDAIHKTIPEEYWIENEKATLPMYDTLLAVKMAGYEASAGMAREWAMAEEFGMPSEKVWPGLLAPSDPFMDNLVEHWRVVVDA